MPQLVRCYKCGALLYRGEDLKSSEEIYQMYDGVCPKCGRKLSLIPQNVRITAARNPVKRRGTGKAR